MSRINWDSKWLIPSSLIRNSSWIVIVITAGSLFLLSIEIWRIQFHDVFDSNGILFAFLSLTIFCAKIFGRNFASVEISSVLLCINTAVMWAYGGYVGIKHIQYSILTLHRLNGCWKLPIKRKKMDFKLLALFLMVLVAFVAAKKPMPPCTFRLFSFQSILFQFFSPIFKFQSLFF